MKTIKLNLYPFNELSEAAQQVALKKFNLINVEDTSWLHPIYSEAKEIGLVITHFTLEGNACCKGYFMHEETSPIESCAIITKLYAMEEPIYQNAVDFLSSPKSVADEKLFIDKTLLYFFEKLEARYYLLLTPEEISKTLNLKKIVFTENGKVYDGEQVEVDETVYLVSLPRESNDANVFNYVHKLEVKSKNALLHEIVASKMKNARVWSLEDFTYACNENGFNVADNWLAYVKIKQ